MGGLGWLSSGEIPSPEWATISLAAPSLEAESSEAQAEH
jgi:hypothetical protein